MNHFSIVSYNIHKGFGIGKLKFILPEIREVLLKLNPEFIFLQEVQGVHLKHEKKILNWPASTQSEYLAHDTWPHNYYEKNAIYLYGHHGNAILSKAPFIKTENISLSKLLRASRGFMYAEIEVNEIKIHLLCVHFGLFKKERITQSRALIEWLNLNVPENEPIIMAGDFNDWRHQLSEIFYKELNINEAFINQVGIPARSFPAFKPTLSVDRVYYRGLQVLNAECLTGKPWALLSDHLPLHVRFKIPNY